MTREPSLFLVVAVLRATMVLGANYDSTRDSQGVYRLPYADGTAVKVFADFATHTHQEGASTFMLSVESNPTAWLRLRLAASPQSRMVLASSKTAEVCQQNYVWIEHCNGDWTNYSHLTKDSVTKKAGLKVGDQVNAGQYIGDEGAVGCAMFDHLHFEVALPKQNQPIHSGGFLTDNDNGKRNLSPRFYGVVGQRVVKDQTYVAVPLRTSNAADVRHDGWPHSGRDQSPDGASATSVDGDLRRACKRSWTPER